ncbi:MAG: SMP-30/gluconolactonase/LRE family protein [Hyphomicrobiaceae bacterium]
MNIREIANGLRFPEGPIACRDGSIIVVEIEAGRLTRVDQSGEKTIIAETGGGPNGAAIGPDGRLYVCNNGGMRFIDKDGLLFPVPAQEGERTTGWIDAVDLDGGNVETIYTECDGAPLKAPNDIVFDATGGFWFTDHGKLRRDTRDRGAVFYAAADGSSIKRVIVPLDSPNGIGLSPDGSELYVAETHPGRLWAFKIDAPGSIARAESAPAPWERGYLLANPSGYCMLDSLAVDARGHVCVASIPHALQVVSPDGTSVQRVEMPDLMPTNICFDITGSEQAYVTLSAGGRLVAMAWPGAGQKLAFEH